MESHAINVTQALILTARPIQRLQKHAKVNVVNVSLMPLVDRALFIVDVSMVIVRKRQPCQRINQIN